MCLMFNINKYSKYCNVVASKNWNDCDDMQIQLKRIFLIQFHGFDLVNATITIIVIWTRTDSINWHNWIIFTWMPFYFYFSV